MNISMRDKDAEQSARWTALLGRAADSGDVYSPDELLRELAVAPDILALFNQSYWDLVEKAPSSFPSPRLMVPAPDDEDGRRISGLARWVFQEIQHCSARCAPDRLLACLVVASYLGAETFWACLPAPGNPHFFRHVAAVLKGMRCCAEIPPTTPLHEKEAWQALLEAAGGGDYLTLNEVLPIFYKVSLPSSLFSCCVHALGHHGWNELRNIVDHYPPDQIIGLMEMVDVLPCDLRYRLASETPNPQVLYLIFHLRRDHFPCPEISSIGRERRGAALLRATEYPQLWQALTRDFNDHLPLAEDIQEDLGRVLAQTSDEAIETWLTSLAVMVDSYVNLQERSYAHISRLCFRAFTKAADKARKRNVLERIRHIYHQYTEGQDSPMSPFLTNLDYALFVYHGQCRPKDDVRRELEQIATDIENMDQVWHASDSAWERYFSRKISDYQILYRALEVPDAKYEENLKCFVYPSFLDDEYHACLLHSLNAVRKYYQPRRCQSETATAAPLPGGG